MQTTYDDEELAVRERLEALATRWRQIEIADRDATRELKDALGHLGTSLGYTAHCSGGDFSHHGEWLFDVTWVKLDEERYITSVPLVAESEWSPGEVEDDFEKLLLARSDHRLFVFWAPDEVRAKTRLAELEEFVRRFRPSCVGDRYLFACWTDTEEAFLFRQLTVEGVG